MKRWEKAVMVVAVCIGLLVLALQLARELYIERNQPRRWSSQPGTFDPSKVGE